MQRIFEEYAAGRSPRTIAHDLNRDSMPAPRGGTWASNTINGTRSKGTGILRVDLYRGRIVWNKMRYLRDPDTGNRVSRRNPDSERRTAEAAHLRIIDDELWARVAARQCETASRGGRLNRPRQRRLLSGIMKCGSCGSGMTVSGSSNGRLRVCCSRYRESGSCSHTRSYFLDAAEIGVVNIVRELLSPPHIYRYICRRTPAAHHRYGESAEQGRSRACKGEGGARQALRPAYRRSGRTGLCLKAQARAAAPHCRFGSRSCTSHPPPTVDLHPAAVGAYKRAMDGLHELLRAGAGAADAKLMESFREVVHSVTVHPVAAKDPMQIEVLGKLSALTGENVAAMVVAGAGFEPAAFRL